jgi:hypothetical protein
MVLSKTLNYSFKVNEVTKLLKTLRPEVIGSGLFLLTSLALQSPKEYPHPMKVTIEEKRASFCLIICKNLRSLSRFIRPEMKIQLFPSPLGTKEV